MKLVSLETRRRMSEAQKGRRHSLETRRKMSEAQKGRRHSLETRRKMSEARKGMKFSKEHCKNIAQVRKGTKASPETLRKMSEAQKRRPPPSLETRKKMSEAAKGREFSLETRQKLSDSLKRGDDITYITQHHRAIRDIPYIEDFWCIPCLLRDGIYRKAEDRARMDHSNLPYRIEYVLPMCRSCNSKHNLYNGKGDKMSDGFVVLFQEVS